MSTLAIRAALETALSAMSPSLETAWENVEFTPTPGTAYQRATLMFARPDDTESVGGRSREQGILQIDLMYPSNAGSGDALTRAELLRSTFARGTSFTSGGTTVTISHTPAVAQGMPDGDRYQVPVSIRFTAPI